MTVAIRERAANIGVFDGAPANAEALRTRLEQRGLRAERFDLVSRWAQPVLPIRVAAHPATRFPLADDAVALAMPIPSA